MADRKPRWIIQKEWIGETAVVIGGGPSLKKEDIATSKTRGWKRIACNNAYLLDLEAEVLAWGDRRWYEWNRHDLHSHKGSYKITWQDATPTIGYKFHILKHADQAPELRQWLQDLSKFDEGTKEYKRTLQHAMNHQANLLAEDPGTIAATNTGQGAINIAYHFGVKRIVLLGFDMRAVKVDGKTRLQWHELHQRGSEPVRYTEIFAPSILVQAAILREKGIEIVNCTPESKLRGVPIVSLETVV